MCYYLANAEENWRNIFFGCNVDIITKLNNLSFC